MGCFFPPLHTVVLDAILVTENYFDVFNHESLFIRLIIFNFNMNHLVLIIFPVLLPFFLIIVVPPLFWHEDDISDVSLSIDVKTVFAPFIGFEFWKLNVHIYLNEVF